MYMLTRRIWSFIYFIHVKGEKPTPQLDMKIMKILTEVSNSIGMFEGKSQGSCWRAGTDLIVTAWHVVHCHICKLLKL
jgi:hypothetical protein